eukprot:Skav211355  [mRNA]  locus=scaffold677:173456:174142:- [translate_table: standard]
MVNQAKLLHGEVVALHVAAAHLHVGAAAEQTLDAVAVQEPRTKRDFPAIFDRNGWDGSIPHSLLHEYGAGLMQKVRLWWQFRTDPVRAGTVQWITCAHLYVDFQLTWGHVGPLKCGKKWLDQTTRPYLEVEKFLFAARLKWFRRMMKVFLKSTNQTAALETLKGAGEAIQSFVPCIAVEWDGHGLQSSDSWLLRQLRKPCLKGAAELRFLPAATKCQQMQLPEAASLG